MLKVWGRKNSINVQKVMWTVAELGLAVERIDAGMSHGVVNEEWYSNLNPNRLVPALQDAEFVLWESNVIVRYLAAKYGFGKLIPMDPAARANAEMWMDWQQTTIMPGLGPLFLGLVRTAPEKRDSVAIQAGAERVEAALRLLDNHLAGRSYTIGDHLSVADIPLGCVVYRWYALEIEHPKLPNLRAWYERLAVRHGFLTHVMLPLT
jgi:glutathione S-transferase